MDEEVDALQQAQPHGTQLHQACTRLFLQKRKPVDVWSFVKSPYGLMIVFSIFAIFVFPRVRFDFGGSEGQPCLEAGLP